MKKTIFLLALSLSVLSCSRSGDLKLTGTVKGLKKGTLYLQKIQDTVLINIDSLKVDGISDFELYADLKEPEVLYLHLDKADASGYDDRIRFFAEPGEMNIITSLKNFESFAAITGSQNQIKMNEYLKMSARFNDKNLDLLKASFEAQKSGDQEEIQRYDDSLQNLLRSKYRYTGNFAATNKDLAIAPYLILTEIPDATVAYLDTLYGRFPKKIKASKYGRDLQRLIKARKKDGQ